MAKRGRMPTELLAAQLGVDRTGLVDTLRKTVMPASASNEDMFAFCLVAHTYKLNPLTREIYAYPKKGGGIQTVVSVDGWLKVCNSQKIDGLDWEEEDEPNGAPISKTCLIYIKGRSRPVRVKERYAECYRNTEPWNNMPHRMLRHKSLIQAARVAFGISGLYEDDEARDFVDVGAIRVEEPAKVEQQRGALDALNKAVAQTEAKAAKETPGKGADDPTSGSDSQAEGLVADLDPQPGEAASEAAATPQAPSPDAPAENPPSPEDEGMQPPTVLPANCTQTMFHSLASMYAPSTFNPDTAEAFAQRWARVYLSKPWPKLRQEEKQAAYDKFVNYQIDWTTNHTYKRRERSVNCIWRRRFLLG
jgi:hypothetical protein